jgi:FixJ family two-component response regulator
MPHQAGKIYVIDDDTASRESVTLAVRPLGLEVPAFDSVEAFLSTYDGQRPACIVADMRMLGTSGNELLQELRQRGLTIPVIVLTAHADTPSIVMAMKNGAFTTLDKPCNNEELWDAVRAALQDDIKRSEEDDRRQEARQRLAQLTSGERGVLKRVLAGEGNKAIAYRLDIGLRTVEARRKALARKLKFESIAELFTLVLLAEPELLPPDSKE